MRKVLLQALLVHAAAALPVSMAWAQAACPIAIGAPVEVSGTTYTLSSADNCKNLIFTSGSAVALTAPSPALIGPSGFRVFLKAQGAGTVTISAATGIPMDGASTQIALTTGLGINLMGAATAKWYSSGIGIAHP